MICIASCEDVGCNSSCKHEHGQEVTRTSFCSRVNYIFAAINNYDDSLFTLSPGASEEQAGEAGGAAGRGQVSAARAGAARRRGDRHPAALLHPARARAVQHLHADQDSAAAPGQDAGGATEFRSAATGRRLSLQILIPQDNELNVSTKSKFCICMISCDLLPSLSRKNIFMLR